MVKMMIRVQNRAGIHARPAAIIAQLANKFKSELTLSKDGVDINAKSIMGIITMAASYDTEMELISEGEDEKEAAEAIKALFDSKFEED